jgi:tRNA 2-selenouridine synthase
MPEALYLAMTVSPMIRVWFSEEFRVSTIIDEYAGLDTASLADSITRISKRLGGLVTSQCLEMLANGDFAGVVRLLLPYYDKTYNHSVERRNRQLIVELDLTGEQPESVVGRIAEKKYKLIQ